MSPRRTIRARAGFTLIEVLVALGVMLVIAMLTWETIAGSLQMRDILEQEDDVRRTGRIAMDRVRRELELAFLTENTSAVNTYRTVFVAEDDDDTDRIWFASRSHRRTYHNARECDQTEITLWVEADPEHSGRYVLLHREAPRVDHEPEKDGAILPLARSISRFDLRFLDSETGEWRDDWDTEGAETPKRLPRAVQIMISVMGPDPDDPDESIENHFVSTVLIESAKGMKRSLLNGGSAGGSAAPGGNVSGGGGGGGGKGGSSSGGGGPANMPGIPSGIGGR